MARPFSIHCVVLDSMQHLAIHRTIVPPGDLRQRARHAFIQAARCGDLDTVMMLWDVGLVTDVDCQSDDRACAGWTALLCAADNQHRGIAQFVLQRGASTESRADQSLTPLHYAALRGNVKLTALLCQFGADVNAPSMDGQTPLHLALEVSSVYVMAYLLNHPAIDLLRRNVFGETMLWKACASGDYGFVDHVLKKLDKAGAAKIKQALVNMPRLDKWTPLNDADGSTSLSTAVHKGHGEIVEYLLARGANAETTDSDDSTPLMIASVKGFDSIVDMLLHHGVKINQRNVNGYSALLFAAEKGHTAIVKTLLAHGAEVGVREIDRSTPLLQAAHYGHVEAVNLLIDHGAEVNCQSYDHWTPLTIAALHEHSAVCALLLEHGASAALQTTDGQTALHLAASSNDQKILRLLLDAGANRSARDFNGCTAANIAMLEGYFSTAELLNETGVSDNDDEIWPRHCLRELYGVTFTSERQQDTEILSPNAPWYIARSSIASIEYSAQLTTYAAQVSFGRWLGARVVIVEPSIAFMHQHGVDKARMHQLFRREVSKLYPLRHPHVTRLYGACHSDEKPFLVMEHPQNGTLRSFVAQHTLRTWTVLHQVALGVQYLHERGIGHHNLKGDDILLGDDGLIKLAGFGAYSMSLKHLDCHEWDAPEVVSKATPSFESDVYSLGMCIIEAVNGESPYAYEVAKKLNIKDLITAGVPPMKPAAISTRGWDVVMRMICFHAHKRLKISDVVRELAALAQDEVLERGVAIIRESAACALDNHCGTEEMFRLARSLLRDSGYKADDDLENPQQLVVGRLFECWQASDSIPASDLALVLSRIQTILTRFVNNLQGQASIGLAASFAAQRQHGDRAFSFHNDIDRLLDQHDELRATATTTTNVHSWRDIWHAHRRAQLQAFGAWLEGVRELDVETCTCLLFELTKCRDAYASIAPSAIHEACNKMRSMPGVRVPEWFIPHYEVVFDAFKSFSRGAFGSVHRGEWMGSPAVIKKVFAEDESEFQKEVEIWSRLYHPHVLQLFGACHVGQKFIMSEFAEHGQLDHYLRRLEKQPAKREREVWRTLHEAALGLQYLHSRGVVHCDLKCNNILIGRDGKAKVSDYGLSRVREQRELRDNTGVHSTHDKPTGVGAPRWKAPEVLNGGEPSFESDVYSFGMCVVEAVSGEYPWGMRIGDELVSDHVRGGGALFSKPRGFSDEQWSLVVGACRFDPCERLQLKEIVTQLEVFANDAKKIESGGKSPSIQNGVAEPGRRKHVLTTLAGLAGLEQEEASTSGWSNNAALSVPSKIDSLSIGAVDTDPIVHDSSYTESWGSQAGCERRTW